jgi:hypothetical protein
MILQKILVPVYHLRQLVLCQENENLVFQPQLSAAASKICAPAYTSFRFPDLRYHLRLFSASLRRDMMVLYYGHHAFFDSILYVSWLGHVLQPPLLS